MQYARILNFENCYSVERKRFSRAAFKKFKGGISVFLESCVLENALTICEHIKAFYYPKPAGSPAIYWIINEVDLLSFQEFTSGLKIEQSNSFTGDKCHYDIIIEDDDKDKKALKFKERYGEFSNDYSPEMYLCCKNKRIKLTKDSCENLLEIVNECVAIFPKFITKQKTVLLPPFKLN